MSFHLNIHDLTRMLADIQISERHVQSNYSELTDAQGASLGNLVPYGLRTVSGQYNNLVHTDYGSADQTMPRLLTPVFIGAETSPYSGQATSYAQTSGSVYDSAPRTISNLISDQSINNPAAIVAALTALGSTDPQGDAAAYLAAVLALQTAEDALPAAQQANDVAQATLQAALVAAASAAQQAAEDAAVALAAQGLADTDGALAAAQLQALEDAQIALALAQNAATAADMAAAVALTDFSNAVAALAAATAQASADAVARNAALEAYGDAAALSFVRAGELADAQALLDEMVESGASQSVIDALQAVVDLATVAAIEAQAGAMTALTGFSTSAMTAATSQLAQTTAQTQLINSEAALVDAEVAAQVASDALDAANTALEAAQLEVDTTAEAAQISQAAADALASVALVSQTAADAAAADVTSAQNAADASALALGSAQAAVDIASQSLLELPTQLGLDFDVNELSLVIPNVMPDLGDTAPFNGFLTLFGQFFDHGLDLVSKGGSGTVYMPLQPDDPLYVEGSPTNFMVLTRATNQPGADGLLGTADDIREHNNETTPFIDLNQVYTSHESHQVFLREYARVQIDGVVRTVATGHMLEGSHGGPPTWADIKAQALEMLGIQLTDLDVHRVPLVAADLYGNFIPGVNGFAQIVTSAGLVEGDPGSPALASSAIGAGRAFLNDIAHSAAPGVVDHDRNPTTTAVVTAADEDSDIGNAIPINEYGVATTYDNELLDLHFIVGDGRGNENIGLTAVHHVFHSEHNTRIEQIQHELLASGDLVFLNQWLLVPVESVPADPAGLLWNGERLFQAARFSTEMVYQHLVFEEFARLISPDVDPFLFSNSVDIDPAIVAEFAHVVYRFGHSMLTETVDRLGADGQTSDNIGLIEAFLDPVEYVASGVDSDESAGAIIRGMSRQVGNEIDEFLTEALRNNLVGLPLDLGSLNIARGRDTGVPSLNEARRQFFEQTNDTTLKPYESWFDFALAIKHPASIINFIAAYGTHGSITTATTLEEKRDAATLLVLGGEGAPADRLEFLNATNGWAGGDLGGLNLVDFWIGGLAEKKMAFGGQLGTTFNFVFEVQMEQLQDGDRFYYLSRAQGMNLLNQLEADSFAELVMRNTDLGNPNATHLPSSLFLTPDHILELDQARQKLADPTHDNAILNAISPMVIRRDTNGDGIDDYLRYTGGDHVVLGGTEQDNTLIGGEGDDTLWGDGGNDRLEGGFGVDHLFGGAGDDIITDSGTDSGAADVIHGDDGNDVINGGNGLDLIFGGRGQDFIFGGVDGKTITAGEGNDFVRGPDGLSFVAGNEGDDWLEGGDSFDTLAGDNTELFFNSTIIGHDVLNGRGNDNDYDAESGDDIMFQGTGIQRNNGMAGFDWAIHKGEAQGADSDLGIPIFVNQQANILRDRFDLVEGLSGWVHDDILTGREVIIGAYDEEAGAAAQFNPDSPFASYANALLQSGVDRIEGLDALVAHLNRVTFTAAGQQETAIVFDESAVERDAAGNAITIYDTAADILLGGGGSDILQGKAGNDIIDGDRWLNVRIGINDVQGNAIAWADDLGSKVYSLAGDELFGGRSLDNLMFDRTLNPGQLSIERMILDGDSLNAAADTAVYRGLRSEYAFTSNDDGSITVAHLAPENNLDDGTDRLFNIEILRFSDGSGGTVDVAVAQLFNVAPDITSDGGNAVGAVLIAENTVDVTQVVAVDPNVDQTLGFSIIGGADAALFDINAATGALSFLAAPNFEAPIGSGNNVYDVIVQVSDGIAVDQQALQVTVQNLDELHTGSVNITSAVGQGNTALLTAVSTVSDPDGMIGAQMTQWQRLQGANWVDLVGQTATTLSGVNNGAFRIASTYTDSFGAKIVVSPETAVVVGSDANNAVLGTAGDDFVLGLLGADTLTGGAGNDTVWGGIGDDTLVATVGDGNDVYNGGIGIDTYDLSLTSAVTSVDLAAGTASSSQTGNDTLIGIENVIGSTGANSITGDAQNNLLTGGFGNDTIRGGAGADIMIGNQNDDLLIADVDNVRDLLAGGLDVDTADYSAYGANLTVTLNGTTAAIVVGSGSTLANSDTVQGIENFIGGSGNDSLTGDGLANNLQGGAGHDSLFGGGGADVLQGGEGNDSLVGGNGADVLQGGGGNDSLVGGNGADVLTGGLGADRFVYATVAQSSGANRDLITDFTQGQDLIDLSGIDANTVLLIGSGSQAFTSLLGPLGNGNAMDFNNVQQLRFSYDADNDLTIVEGNVNLNAASEFQIALVGQHNLTLADFVL